MASETRTMETASALSEELRRLERALRATEEERSASALQLRREQEGYRRALRGLQSQIEQDRAYRRRLEDELRVLKGSAGWALLQRVRELRLRVAPAGSRRDAALRRILSLVPRRALSLEAEAPTLPEVVEDDTGSAGTALDILCFPVIDWVFRFQRPQQLLRRSAREGSRVFYLRTRFHDGPAPLVRPIEERVYAVELPGDPQLNLYRDEMSPATVDALVTALDDLRRQEGIALALSLVHLPFWAPLALELRERHAWKVVYDRMDDHAGFSTNGAVMLAAEERLVQSSDLVVATSRSLLEASVRQGARRAMLVPNAADVDHFTPDPGGEDPLAGIPRPILGYYGAISEWFDVEMVRAAAVARPDWQLVLIGDTFGADVSGLRSLPNVFLLGEKPYASLPAYLHRFDVACIPFRRTPLTEATNPVKFYEYLAAGKPVVAVALPELEPHRGHFFPVESGGEFVAQVEAALASPSPEAAKERVAVARAHTWAVRHAALSDEVRRLYPRAVVVIVSYNNPVYLRQCLQSLWANTLYPHFDVVVVDNASGSEVVGYLQAAAQREPRLKLVLNEVNVGFARANNIGIAAAGDCEYLVLLNDDTIVTHGWLPRLLRHLERPGVGLVGPVTNSCGNEARIEVPYEDADGIAAFARRHSREHDGESFEIPMLAMYCLAMKRALYDELGPLDEQFGIGLFEDDDYAMRARRRGRRLVCTRDVFVHHWGRASFSRLESDEYRSLFEENRWRFEQKWGVEWTPPYDGGRTLE